MDSISQGKNEVIAKSGTYTLIDFWLVLGRWQEKRRVRRYLARLPDYLLKDIGLERRAVMLEAAKPFWR
ncbi:MAG: hypothetical protein ACI9RY_001040 [Reinekea sp.]|jgi:uncharacterized protein YjiS (DUF1127 family)